MDELDDLEDVYFGKTKIPNAMEKAQLSGLFEYAWMLKPPKEPSIHIPYNLVIKLARLAPKGSETEFITSMLREYSYLEKTEKGLDSRIRYALNWAEDFTEEAQKVTLTDQDATIIQTVIIELKKTSSPEDYQNAIFNAAKISNLKPRDVFQVVYKLLLGKSQGPKLGPYIALIGREVVISEFESALKNK
jgi:lysyl-tRNA synthetase class 1